MKTDAPYPTGDQEAPPWRLSQTEPQIAKLLLRAGGFRS